MGTEDKAGLQRQEYRDTPLPSTQHMVGAISLRPECVLGSYRPAEVSELLLISAFQSLLK